MPSRPSPVLGRAVELLVEASDPAQRARILLRAVQAAFGAHAVALCRPRADGGWARIALPPHSTSTTRPSTARDNWRNR